MMELIQRGGPAMWLMLAISLAAMFVFLQRLYELHRAQIRVGDFLKGIFNNVQRGNLAEAVTICEETPGPVAQLVRAALLQQGQDAAQIRQAMEEAGAVEIPRLEKNLVLLMTFAQVAPLAGLLGTVLGMVQVLATIQEKAPLIHAGDLSGGLWQALISTATGLAIAIPVYAGHNLLVARVDSILVDMEKAFLEVLGFLGSAAAEKKE
jgi:biopolymer transport protein ExbB